MEESILRKYLVTQEVKKSVANPFVEKLNSVLGISGNDIQKLATKLDSMKVETKSVCAKILKRNMGAWVCRTCEKDSSCIICTECFENSNHEGHTYYFKNSVSGCCDCGDPDSWDIKGFCKDHKGLLTTPKEVEDLIRKTFSQREIDGLVDVLHDSARDLCEKLLEYDVNPNPSRELSESIAETISLYNAISKSNQAMMHLVVNTFDTNYPIFTTHVCFQFRDSENGILEVTSFKPEYNQNNTIKDHACKCSLLQNILRVWDKQFDNIIDINNVFINFLQSYKFKFICAYSYISLFDKIMLNESQSLRSVSVQIVTIEEVGIKICSCRDFIAELFNKFNVVVKGFIDKGLNSKISLKDLMYTVYEFCNDIRYLMKEKPLQIISKNPEVLSLLIESIGLFHHINVLTLELGKGFIREGYKETLVSLESELLDLFSFLITNFDFEALGDTILSILVNKVLSVCDNLKENEYSAHIPYNRLLSIFLLRYSVSIYLSTNQPISVIIEKLLANQVARLSQTNPSISYSSLLYSLYKDVLRVISFMNSISAKYWVNYGENCIYYPLFYFYRGVNVTYAADFTLLRLLLSPEPHLNTGLNFKKFIEGLMSVGSQSYLDIVSENENQNFDKKITLLVKSLEVVSHLMRTSDYITDLLFITSSQIKKNKLNDKYLEQLVLNMKSEISGLNRKLSLLNLKNRLINIIFSKDNSCSFSDALQALPLWLSDNFKPEIEDLIFEICDKTKQGTKAFSFRVKKDFIKSVDLAYLKDFKEKANAERLILENYKGVLTTFNTSTDYFYDLSFLEELDSNFHNNLITSNFFFTLLEKFIEFFGKSKNSHESAQIAIYKIYYQSVIFFIKFPRHLSERVIQLFDKLFGEFTENLRLTTLNRSLTEQNTEIIKSAFEELSGLFEKVKPKPNKYEGANIELDIQGNLTKTISSEQRERPLKAKLMKEKLIKEFRERSERINKALNINKVNVTSSSLSTSSSVLGSTNSNQSTISGEEKLTKTTSVNMENSKDIQCCICLHFISDEGEDLRGNPYGKLGYKNNNKLSKHIKKRNLNYQFERFEEEILKMGVKPTVESEERKEKLRQILSEQITEIAFQISTCNHYIHFDCYNSFITKSLLLNFKFAFFCPMCKSLSNVLIPFSGTAEEQFSIEEAYKERYNGVNIQDSISTFKREEFDQDLQLTVNFIEQTFKTQFKFTEDSLTMENPLDMFSKLRNYFKNSAQLMVQLGFKKYSKHLNNLNNVIEASRKLINLGIVERRPLLDKFNYLYFDVLYTTKGMDDDELTLADIIHNNYILDLFTEVMLLHCLLIRKSELSALNILIRHTLPFVVLRHVINLIYLSQNFTLENREVVLKGLGEKLELEKAVEFYPLLLKEIFLPFLKRALFVKMSLTKENDINLIDKLDSLQGSDVNTEYSFIANLLDIPESFKDLIDTNYYPLYWKNQIDIKEIYSNLVNTYIAKTSSDGCLVEQFSLLDYKVPKPIEFSILPNDLITLSVQNSKINCSNENCERRSSEQAKHGLVCLLCGDKVCFNTNCCYTYRLNKKFEEFAEHAKVCNSGNVIYVHTLTGKALFIIQGKLIDANYFIYRNRFGETVSEYNTKISSEYVLDRESLETLYNDFVGLRLSKYYKKSITNRQINFDFAF